MYHSFILRHVLRCFRVYYLWLHFHNHVYEQNSLGMSEQSLSSTTKNICHLYFVSEISINHLTKSCLSSWFINWYFSVCWQLCVFFGINVQSLDRILTFSSYSPSMEPPPAYSKTLTVMISSSIGNVIHRLTSHVNLRRISIKRSFSETKRPDQYRSMSRGQLSKYVKRDNKKSLDEIQQVWNSCLF